MTEAEYLEVVGEDPDKLNYDELMYRIAKLYINTKGIKSIEFLNEVYPSTGHAGLVIIIFSEKEAASIYGERFAYKQEFSPDTSFNLYRLNLRMICDELDNFIQNAIIARGIQ
jgi:hypothetical protein